MGQTPSDPDLPIETLLPLRSLVVTLEFTQPSAPNLFHQAALASFLRELIGSPEDYDRLFRIDAPESGNTRYQPGDLYRFQIFLLAGCDPLLPTLFQRLTELPDSATRDSNRVPFRDNLRLYALHDAFTEEPLSDPRQLAQYNNESLQREIQLWQEQTRFEWRWLTPARLQIAKQPGKRRPRDERGFCHNSEQATPELLLSRLHDNLADLLRRRGAPDPGHRGTPPPLEAEYSHLFWFNNAYFDEQGNQAPMGGLSGRIILTSPRPLSNGWWKLLVLGQYTGIGRRTAFGWGRYQLITSDGGFTLRRTLPAAPLLSKALGEENLAEAWKHVLRNAQRPDDPAEMPPEDEWSALVDEADFEPEPTPPLSDTRISDGVEQLRQARYQPPNLRGRITPKPNGAVRPLAIPPFEDRVLQRAVAQQLAPGLESLMYPRSYGYRKGLSRASAGDDIQAAWQAGYRWVYESDIADFFDTVDLQRLRERLQALYGDDPVIEAIIAWMQAPVRFQDQIIERPNGLPQGAPLSPLMANLMLDDFDNDMSKAGFRLVRFADDFVVLCKDPKEAEAAGQAAVKSLAEHGLKLNPDKTRITAMEDGFRYLGYLFVNDLVLDVSGKKGASSPAGPPPPNSWLARLGEKSPLKVEKKSKLGEVIARRRPAATTIGERRDERTLLCVTGDICVLTTRARHLRVLRDDKVIYDLPWRSLQAVILFGHHQITTQAMHAALDSRTPIHLADAMGRYRGAVAAQHPAAGSRLWLQQSAAAEEPENALYIGRELVAARVRHMREHLRQRMHGWDDPRLAQAIANAGKAQSLNQLLGIEGSATRAYFEQLAEVIPPEFGFNGRNRRPPRDPFNVLLSLGYTLLYGYSDSILRAVGLSPWQGLYHQPRGTHAALASDLMEPFRHIIERTAATQLIRGALSAENFSHTPAGACLIDADARRAYLAELLKQFDKGVKAKGEEEPRKLFGHLHAQALSMRRWLEQGQPFRPWRMR